MIQSLNIESEVLRFTTSGSVDNGKSTLIGRLLFDSKAIYQDQLEAMELVRERKGEDRINLAFITDGLREEREKGITIDVAYRYFSTPKRKFIIADTPGHIEYTRNMVTGASTANVAVLLVDAEIGMEEQTRRHLILASLLQIPHVVICMNKMDLVQFDERRYSQIKSSLEAFSAKLLIKDIQYIPISALLGDNVVDRSENMPWYEGTTLLYYLEQVHISGDQNLIDCRFPVQYVIQGELKEDDPQMLYGGRVEGGVFKPGDEVMVLPGEIISGIVQIRNYDETIMEAFSPMSITMELEPGINLNRGDMIVRKHNSPKITQDIELMICWFDQYSKLDTEKEYIIKHTTNECLCNIAEVRYKLDIDTLHRKPDDLIIKMNDIARIRIHTSKPLFVDPYNKNRYTGSVILIDKKTNNTVGAGMVL